MAKNKKTYVYIDGFNLFFSLKENKWKKYYWLDLVNLSSEMLRPGHFLSRVNYFTAPVKRPPDKKERQQTYLKALKSLNFFAMHYGKYKYTTIVCRNCTDTISVPKEKRTDVKIASFLLMDAIRNECDVQYLLTGDSDFVPPVQLLSKYYPEREVYLICPPKNVIPYSKFKSGEERPLNRVSDALINVCKGHQYITEDILKSCLLPENVINKKGQEISRPTQWK
jgi:uncharacterized LabA/DUF88 family protein